MAAKIYLGTQGWNYEGWTGPFYPRGVSSKETLKLYSKVFDTVEIDSTFYAVPAAHSVRGWAERTPAGFVFSVKLPSEITHKNRLRDSQEILDLFTERMRMLGKKLGSILIQLPPDFPPSEHQALKGFLAILPSDIRFAIEFRDAGWLNEAVFGLLAERNVALTLTDSRWIRRDQSFRMIEDYATDFAYVRWLGPRDLTDFSRVQIDRTMELGQWAEAFQLLKDRAQTIFGYFNNHFQGHSPASCNQFKQMIGLPATDPQSLVEQPSLF